MFAPSPPVWNKVMVVKIVGMDLLEDGEDEGKQEHEVVLDEEVWAGGDACSSVRDLALAESLWQARIMVAEAVTILPSGLEEDMDLSVVRQHEWLEEKGENIEGGEKRRQAFFRQAILASFAQSYCVSGQRQWRQRREALKHSRGRRGGVSNSSPAVRIDVSFFAKRVKVSFKTSSGPIEEENVTLLSSLPCSSLS